MVRGPEGPPQSEESRTLDSANSTPAPQRLAGLPRLRLSAPGSPAGSGVERGVMSVLSLLIECVELKAQALISPGCAETPSDLCGDGQGPSTTSVSGSAGDCRPQGSGRALPSAGKGGT